MTVPAQSPKTRTFEYRSVKALPTGNELRTSRLHIPTAQHESHPRWAIFGLIGLRLALGFEFLWAFLDKTLGLGYSTSNAHAWINGGSPTTGFLSGANAGPLQGVFRAMAGVSAVDWVFMLGLLGIGLALILGVALRIGAIGGAVMLGLMWMAVWAPATMAAGQPTKSANPIVDQHFIGIFGLILIAALANWGTGYLGQKWVSLEAVKTRRWLV